MGRMGSYGRRGRWKVGKCGDEGKVRRRGRWGGGEGEEEGEVGRRGRRGKWGGGSLWHGVEHIVLPLLGESVRHMGSSFY